MAGCIQCVRQDDANHSSLPKPFMAAPWLSLSPSLGHHQLCSSFLHLVASGRDTWGPITAETHGGTHCELSFGPKHNGAGFSMQNMTMRRALGDLGP